MKQRLLIVSFAITAGGLISWLALSNVSLRSENIRFRSALAQTGKPSPSVPTTEANSESSSQKAKFSETTISSNRKAIESSASRSNQTVVRTLWADPQFRAASVERTLNDLEARYGRFFLTLKNLPREKLEAIKTMLATQSVDLAALSIPQQNLETPQATENRLAAYAELQRTQELAVRTTMGAEVFQQYVLAQQTEPYRETVAAIANGMRSQGFAVKDDMQEKMLSAYAAAIMETASIAQREDGKIDYTLLDAEGRRVLRERQIQRAQLQLARAMSGILDREALDTFIAAQISRDYSP